MRFAGALLAVALLFGLFDGLMVRWIEKRDLARFRAIQREAQSELIREQQIRRVQKLPLVRPPKCGGVATQ